MRHQQADQIPLQEVPEGGKREKKAESIVKEIMVENFLTWGN